MINERYWISDLIEDVNLWIRGTHEIHKNWATINIIFIVSHSHSSRGCGTWFFIQGEWSSIKLMVRLGCQWFRISKALLFSVWNISEDKSQKWSFKILYNRAVSISVSGLQNGWPGWDLDAHLSLLSIDWQFYGTSFSCICWDLNIHVAVDKSWWAINPNRNKRCL